MAVTSILVAGLTGTTQLSNDVILAKATQAGAIKSRSKGKSDPADGGANIGFELYVAAKPAAPAVAQRQLVSSQVTVGVTAREGKVDDKLAAALKTALGNNGWSTTVPTPEFDAISGEAVLDYWKRS